MTKLYRPSNHTEGSIFEAEFCAQCAREVLDEQADNYAACDIHLRAIAFEIQDPAYPIEWTYGEHKKPICSAFTQDEKRYRCTKTVDMFEPANNAARDYVNSQFSGPITKVPHEKPDEGFLKCCKCGSIAMNKEHLPYEEQCCCIHEECDGQMMCNKWPNWSDADA